MFPKRSMAACLAPMTISGFAMPASQKCQEETREKESIIPIPFPAQILKPATSSDVHLSVAYNNVQARTLLLTDESHVCLR